MNSCCLKPTHTNSLPVLAGNAPSYIRRAVASRTERTRQTTDQRHTRNGHIRVVPRLQSRKSFIKCTEPINTTAKAARMELWRERLEPLDANVHLTSVLTNTSWRREPLDNREGTQPVAYTFFSSRVDMFFFSLIVFPLLCGVDAR